MKIILERKSSFLRFCLLKSSGYSEVKDPCIILYGEILQKYLRRVLLIVFALGVIGCHVVVQVVPIYQQRILFTYQQRILFTYQQRILFTYQQRILFTYQQRILFTYFDLNSFTSITDIKLIALKLIFLCRCKKLHAGMIRE